MEDIPQPSRSLYAVGDRVRLYLDPDDPDAHLHGTVCAVVNVETDDLDAETGRPMDAYSYTVRDLETNDMLPFSVRHRDLVPAEDIQ